MSDTPELGALRVETRSDEESGIVVALAGELDLSTVSRFVNAIDDALDDRPPALELDLSELTFIDSSGLRVLVSLSKDAQARGTTLGLRNIPRHAQRVLDITGLTEWFDGQANAES